PYTHNTPGAVRQSPTPRKNSRTVLQATMCSVLALNTASTGATRQGSSRVSSAMGARRLDVPSSRIRSASGASCSPRSLGRQLSEPAPDEGALQLMFSSAVRAPDHGRLRPWRFVVVRGGARERLGELFADHARRAQPQLGAQALQRERLKALRAPLIVVVA